MSSSLSVTKVENEIKGIIYASDHTFKDIEKWGQNTKKDWFHPLTSGQRKDSFPNVKKGDILKFVYISRTKDTKKTTDYIVKVIDVGSPQKYVLLENLYGPLKTAEWGHAYTDTIRVARC